MKSKIVKSKIWLSLVFIFIYVLLNYRIIFAKDYSDEKYFQLKVNSEGQVILEKYLLTMDMFLKDNKEVDVTELKSPDVQIPNEVNYIADNAFKDCILGNVTMSDNVKGIGECAFRGTKAMSIRLSNNIEIIKGRTFSRCSFKEITLPYNLEELGVSAFEGCTLLRSVNIPNKVKKIETSAFESCIRLDKVSIPSSVNYIGCQAFYLTNLESVYIPKEVKEIGDEAFDNNVIIVGEKNSEAQEYAKRNGNRFMTPGEVKLYLKYVNWKTISMAIVLIIAIIIAICRAIIRRMEKQIV